MNPEQHQFLTLAVLPARLNAEQTAQFLGFQAHDLTILMAAGLLRPLGVRPAANSPKYFATVELQRLRDETKWLSKATDAVQNHWRHKNRTPAPRATAGQRRPGAESRNRFTESTANPELAPRPNS